MSDDTTDDLWSMLADLVGPSIVCHQHFTHERFTLSIEWTPDLNHTGWKLLDFAYTTTELTIQKVATIELWRRDGVIIYREVTTGLQLPNPDAGSRFGLNPIWFEQTSDLQLRVRLTDPDETVMLIPPVLAFDEAARQS